MDQWDQWDHQWDQWFDLRVSPMCPMLWELEQRTWQGCAEGFGSQK